MRSLTRGQLKDIARGAAVLGTGGGGDPYLGTLAALRAFEEFGSPTVIDPDEIPDYGLVALPVMVGAPVPFIEKLSLGSELDTVFEALTGSIDGEVVALMSPEMGGANSVVPLLLGSRLGIPVVDGDAMGRAYPEINLVTLTLYGISASPFALADEHGNSLVIDAVNNEWVERIARAAVVEFGAICAGMGFTMTGDQLREAAVLRTLTYAEQIGRGVREARGEKRDPIGEILKIANGFVLFKGKIIDVDRQTTRGWSVGSASIDGIDEFRESHMEVKFQNENLVALCDELPVAMVPDLITIMDAETGEAITTERLRYGFRVVVLGMPCDDKWRTESGVALGGPRHFGYDLDYRPVEELNDQTQQKVGDAP